MESLHNPSVRTYYILQNGSYIVGYVDPGQYMDSGLSNLETFTEKTVFLNRCEVLGIDCGDLDLA